MQAASCELRAPKLPLRLIRNYSGRAQSLLSAQQNSPSLQPCPAIFLVHCFNLGNIISIGRGSTAEPSTPKQQIIQKCPGAGTLNPVTQSPPLHCRRCHAGDAAAVKIGCFNALRDLCCYIPYKNVRPPRKHLAFQLPRCCFNVGVGRPWARLSRLHVSTVLFSRRVSSGNSSPRHELSYPCSRQIELYDGKSPSRRSTRARSSAREIYLKAVEMAAPPA